MIEELNPDETGRIEDNIKIEENSESKIEELTDNEPEPLESQEDIIEEIKPLTNDEIDNFENKDDTLSEIEPLTKEDIETLNENESSIVEDELSYELNYSPVDEVMNETTEEERKIYSELPLEVGAVDDRESLQRTDIDFLKLDSSEKCNLDKLQEGKPPSYEDASIELHHLGQSMDAPLAELTSEEHRGPGNFSTLHDLTHESEIDRKAFEREKRHYWKARGQDVIEKEIRKTEET